MSRPDDQCTICTKYGHRASQCPDGEAFRRSGGVEAETTLKREQVLAEIVKAGAAGINAGELRKITGFGIGSIDCALRHLSAKGLVFLGGHGTGMRRFSTQEWADEYHTATSLDVAIKRVAQILADAGDDGISTPELMKLEARRLSEALITMRKSGQAFFAGKNHTFRNFATQEQAQAYAVKSAARRIALKRQNDKAHKQAWLAKQPPKPPKVKAEKPPKPPKLPKEPKPKAAKPKTPKPGKALVIKAKSAPTPKPIPTQIIIPESVKITRIPTPEPRFSVSGKVIGGFATMGIGRYL